MFFIIIKNGKLVTDKRIKSILILHIYSDFLALPVPYFEPVFWILVELTIM